MRVLAVDAVTLINQAVCNNLELFKGYMGTGAFKSLSLGWKDIESDLNHTITALSAWAFRNDAKILIIDGGTPYHHLYITSGDLEDIPNIAFKCVLDPMIREHYAMFNISLPTTAQLCDIFSELMKPKYVNIVPVSLNLDYDTTLINLNYNSLVHIEELDLDEITKRGTEDGIVISPYTFYNMIAESQLVVRHNDRLDSFIKTQAELALSTVFN